ncbi:vWA domain-containing protein [Butyrivibrio sp. XPD2006]|uniref:vWA domain-containing protein n=1 Tax=Butyrivibrio sp. XPD2006 TaxID=1280668 RepID=UPI0003B52361|nr:vWA domain-containing protein [Butyrivibrio sp. XPD2006]
MELMYLNVVIIGIVILMVTLLVIYLLHRRYKASYTSGIKAANTARIRSSKLYKSLNIRYRLLSVIMLVGMIGSIVASLFLAARPYRTDDVVSGVKKRDIILCLDVSYSLYDLNSEITDYLKNVVSGLEGDRFGISIFNTSSVTYVPLTDDYDYVLDRLDALHEYFVMQKEYEEGYVELYETYDEIPDDKKQRFDELQDKLDYFEAGTLYDNYYRGSSLIGEGLGTALYSFPYLGNSERTRVIIMCTDNELNAYGREVLNLKEASEYCKKNKVTVFGIFPSEEKFYMPDEYDYSSCLNGFKNAVEYTGGKFYIRTASQSVSEIVQDIQKQEAMLVKIVMTRQTVDLPRVPFIIMFICLAFGCAAGLVLQK